LSLLVSHPSASAIPEVSADIIARSIDLVRHEFQTATEIALLAGQIGGENAQKFLDGFFLQDNWSGEFLRSVPLGLLTLVLAKHPSLIAQPALWARTDYMSTVAKLLALIDSDRSGMKPALIAMIESGAWDAVSAIVSHRGAEAATEMFLLIENSNAGSIEFPDSIYSELADCHDVWTTLIENGRLGLVALKLLTAELDPRSWYVRNVSVELWASVLDAKVGFSSQSRSLRSAVFTLVMGLSSATPGAARLVASAFFEVYAAAAKDEIAPRVWQELEPSLSWYSPSWDRCARLIRTVARAFKERAWGLQEFMLTFKAPEVLSLALLEIEQTYRGSRYIDRLKEEAVSGNISFSPEQLAVLTKA
jgi:hypothetical protein